MHSVPNRTRKEDKRSRLEQYGDGHAYCVLPDADGVEYMTQLFIQTGMVSSGGMSIAPITWAEIWAFDCVAQLELSAWEAEQLMDMSREYTRWIRKGSEQKDIPDNVPYIDDSEEARKKMRESVIKQRDATKKHIAETLA